MCRKLTSRDMLIFFSRSKKSLTFFDSPMSLFSFNISLSLERHKRGTKIEYIIEMYSLSDAGIPTHYDSHISYHSLKPQHPSHSTPSHVALPQNHKPINHPHAKKIKPTSIDIWLYSLTKSLWIKSEDPCLLAPLFNFPSYCLVKTYLCTAT